MKQDETNDLAAAIFSAVAKFERETECQLKKVAISPSDASNGHEIGIHFCHPEFGDLTYNSQLRLKEAPEPGETAQIEMDIRGPVRVPSAPESQFIVAGGQGYVLESHGDFFWTSAPNQATRYSQSKACAIAEIFREEGQGSLEVLPADASSGVTAP